MSRRLLSACLTVLAFGACRPEPPVPAGDARPSPTVASRKAPSHRAADGGHERVTAHRPDAGLTGQDTPTPQSSRLANAASADAGIPLATGDSRTPMPAPASLPEEPLALAHEDGERVPHLARAESLRSLGLLEDALVEYRRALHATPDDPQLVERLAQTARSARNHALAAKAFGRLAELSPDDAVPRIQQARALLAAGDTSGALRTGADALARDPASADAYQVLGRAHLQDGELPLAIVQLEQAITLAPGHGWALNNLGFAYLRANRNPQAVEVLERAAELLPHVAYVHNNLGVALERTGDPEGARVAFARATSLSPRYVKARVNALRLGRVARVSSPETGGSSTGAPGSDAAEPEEDGDVEGLAPAALPRGE